MRDQRTIEDMMNDARDIVDTGESQVPGMSYEDGVAAALLWAIGDTDDKPIQEIEEG